MPPLGQRIRYGRVDAPDGTSPTFRRWIPAPASTDDDHDLDAGTVYVATPGTDGSDVVGGDLGIGRPFAVGMTDYFGYAYEDYDLVVGVDEAVAIEGPIDPGIAAEALHGSGYADAGDYGGYALYDRGGPARTTAVADGQIVHSAGRAPRRDVTALIDARAGDLARLHERNEAFDRVSRQSGTRPFLLGGTGDGLIVGLEPEVSLSGMDFDDEAVYSLSYLVFPEGDSPSASEIRRQLTSFRDAVHAVAVDLQVDGRLAVVEARMDPGEFLEGTSSQEPPLATWSAEVGPDQVVLRHVAGQTVPADQLQVGAAHDDPLDRQFGDEYEVVAPGAALSIDRTAVANRAVTIQWKATDAQTTSTLFRYELP